MLCLQLKHRLNSPWIVCSAIIIVPQKKGHPISELKLYYVYYILFMVWIERPILGLLRCVTDTKVKDKDVCHIQSAVGVVAQADGPTVAGSFAVSGTILAVLQAWHRGFDWPSGLCATIAII